MRCVSSLALLLAIAVTGCQSSGTTRSDIDPGSGPTGGEAKVSFAKDIKPILSDRCITCHNSETLPGRLNFESAKGAFVNDAQGKPYIVPGKPEESRLYVAVIAPDFYDLAMPPVSHRVSKQGAAKIHQWIAEGAEWPTGPEGQIVATEKALE